MDRFTERSHWPDGHWMIPLVRFADENGKLPQNGQYVPQTVIDRFADYEDTGLEPEKIKSWDLRNNVWRDTWERYSKAEHEGRLIVLPCKVGDTVYTAQRGVVSELSVDHFELYNVGIELYNVGIWVSWNLISGIYGKFRMDGFPASDIGKTVFLTREAAEAALERSKSDGD